MGPKSVRCRVVVGTSGVQLFWFQKIVDRQVAQRGTARARCAPLGLARALGCCYCGSALRMAWVSSATAIRQNSNWDLVCTIPARTTVNMALTLENCQNMWIAIITNYNRQSLSGHLTAALVPDVLQRCGDVDLLGALGHAVEHHIDEDISSRAAHSVAEKKGVSKEFLRRLMRAHLQWMIMGQERPL